MKARDIPNLISILRIFLVAPTVYYLLNQQFHMALLLFIIAGVSDGVDGFLARYFHWKTRLGAMLDPIGDKLLLISCFLALGWLGYVPLSLVVLVILRDVVIVAGAIVYHMFIEEVAIRPLLISKINTLLQIVLVVLIIFVHAGLALSDWIGTDVIKLVVWLVYASTVASGIVYIWSWGHRAMSVTQNRGTS